MSRTPEDPRQKRTGDRWDEIPPFEPDPELIGHMENNQRETRRMREAARQAIERDRERRQAARRS